MALVEFKSCIPFQSEKSRVATIVHLSQGKICAVQYRGPLIGQGGVKRGEAAGQTAIGPVQFSAQLQIVAAFWLVNQVKRLPA